MTSLRTPLRDGQEFSAPAPPAGRAPSHKPDIRAWSGSNPAPLAGVLPRPAMGFPRWAAWDCQQCHVASVQNGAPSAQLSPLQTNQRCTQRKRLVRRAIRLCLMSDRIEQCSVPEGPLPPADRPAASGFRAYLKPVRPGPHQEARWSFALQTWPGITATDSDLVVAAGVERGLQKGKPGVRRPPSPLGGP